MNRLILALAGVLALTGSAQGFPEGPSATGDHAMVASAHRLASEAGREILQKGGNAVDAAAATAFALAVTYPVAGNLGGGGFMLVHTPGGKDTVIDFRETAPASATRDMYQNPDGSLVKGEGSSTRGWRASGVPGTVAGLAYALAHYGSGRVSWAQVIEPARRLAADGWAMTPGVCENISKHAAGLDAYPESRRIFLPGGRAPVVGSLFRQPDLARTLARLQERGPGEFYNGETARLIAAAMAANHGTLTLADLGGYRVAERTPLVGTYRGYEIVTMPPPSSGGIALLQMLAMLEPHPVAALGFDSPARYHLFAEAMRRAFRDRAEYLGDPDFLPVPVAGLLKAGYAVGLMGTFDPAHATPSRGLAPGNPEGAGALARALDLERARRESHETTHFAVVDALGGAVSCTYTLNGAYGSSVTVPGTGFLLNNEMDDFAAKPGSANLYGLVQGEADAVAPGHRPLSSMTPTFVMHHGRLFLATGSPGGPTIINTVLAVITNVVDFQMPLPQAVAAPRVHHQWLPDTLYLEAASNPGLLDALRAMGQEVKVGYPAPSDAESVMIDPATGRRIGASDPRSRDAAPAGY
jgi:gamma-glutamyltranspeptidase / glutathione hydrolase